MNLSGIELENLIKSYANTIRSICRKYYLAGGSEEDLFQEGMIGLFEACKNYKGNDDYQSDQFKSFAKLCIKRQIYDAIKKANKKNNLPLNQYLPINKTNFENHEYEREDLLFLEDEQNPEYLFLDKEEHDEKVLECKSKLSEFENQVLALYLAGERQSEIAKTLNKSVKSIDNTIQRIKNKVRLGKE